MSPPRTAELGRALANQADRLLPCVHCGFCLPACPTYRRLGDENDSPRGRLHLMRAVVEGRLAPDSEAFQTHIDRCLGCRACEPVCPSGVEYGALLELARASAGGGRDRMTRLLLEVMGRPALRRPALLIARLLRATRLPRLVCRFGGRGGPFGALRLGAAMLAASSPAGLARLAARPSNVPAPHTLPTPPNPAIGLARLVDRPSNVPAPHALPTPPNPATGLAATEAGRPSHREATSEQQPGVAATAAPDEGQATPATNGTNAGAASPARTGRPAPRARPHQPPGRGRVAALAGCIQAGLFNRVGAASRRTLASNGYAIVGVRGQGCCGALHAHAGEIESARSLARANIAAFEAAEPDWIAADAAGCGSAMKDYPELFAHDPEWRERAEAFSRRVRDVTELLAAAGPRSGAPVPGTGAYDHPCHLLHAQGVRDAPLEVLGAVPGFAVEVADGAEECCGGAGVYGITQRELGWRVGSDKVEAVARCGADIAVTPNPGCAMQIGAGLRLTGRRSAVAHPVELLDESYRRAGLYTRSPPGQ